MMLYLPACVLECDHYLGKGKCKAYPKGIPKDITTGEAEHHHVRPDQKGKFVFAPKKENHE